MIYHEFHVKTELVVMFMAKKEKPACRLGDFAGEREKIVEEYAKGKYLKTIADIAMEEEERKKKEKKNENK